MKTEHTPGPWKAEQANGCDETAMFVTGNGCTVAACYGDWHDQAPDSEQRANARLIAAAPELLEALKNTTAYLAVQLRNVEPGPATAPVRMEMEADLRRARAAIAQAEGR